MSRQVVCETVVPCFLQGGVYKTVKSGGFGVYFTDFGSKSAVMFVRDSQSVDSTMLIHTEELTRHLVSSVETAQSVFESASYSGPLDLQNSVETHGESPPVNETFTFFTVFRLFCRPF